MSNSNKNKLIEDIVIELFEQENNNDKMSPCGKSLLIEMKKNQLFVDIYNNFKKNSKEF
jgi:hypothetical protein